MYGRGAWLSKISGLYSCESGLCQFNIRVPAEPKRAEEGFLLSGTYRLVTGSLNYFLSSQSLELSSELTCLRLSSPVMFQNNQAF